MKALRITLPTIEENINTESYSLALEVMEQATEMAEHKLDKLNGAKIFQMEMKELREKLKSRLEEELFTLMEEYFEARVCTVGKESQHMTTSRSLEGMVEVRRSQAEIFQGRQRRARDWHHHQKLEIREG